MTAFRARHARFVGTLQVPAPVDEVFPLFSPQGERSWVPGWEPEILHPPAGEWREGQVFKTQEEEGEAVWIVSRLNREEHSVEYHRVEPARYVAHVAVGCEASSGRRTRVSTAYAFVGLSEIGNQTIARMTQETYEAKMSRWSAWINRYLENRGRQRGI